MIIFYVLTKLLMKTIKYYTIKGKQNVVILQLVFRVPKIRLFLEKSKQFQFAKR